MNETETRVIQLRAKDYPKVRERKEGFYLEPLEEAWHCLDFGLLASRPKR